MLQSSPPLENSGAGRVFREETAFTCLTVLSCLRGFTAEDGAGVGVGAPPPGNAGQALLRAVCQAGCPPHRPVLLQQPAVRRCGPGRRPQGAGGWGRPCLGFTTCKSRPVDPHLTACLNIRFRRPHLGPGPAGREAGSENQEALGSRELCRRITPHTTEALPDTRQPPACHVTQTAGLPTLVGKGVRLRNRLPHS